MFGAGRYRSINFARCSGGCRTVWMGTRAGRQGTTGAKEQAVVAVVARTDPVSAELRSVQAGEYACHCRAAASECQRDSADIVRLQTQGVASFVGGRQRKPA